MKLNIVWIISGLIIAFLVGLMIYSVSGCRIELPSTATPRGAENEQ